MNIQIDEKHRLRSDPHQFIIDYQTINAAGQFTGRWLALGYYPTIQQALNGLADHQIKSLEINNLADAIKGIDEIIDKFAAAIEKGMNKDKKPHQAPAIPDREKKLNRLQESPDEWISNEIYKWLEKNYHIYHAFEKRAFRLINLGYRHGSAVEIVEVIRWHSRLAEKESQYKINNNYRSGLARAFAYLNPAHKDFFQFRGHTL